MGGVFNTKNYSLAKTLESGQVFRWRKIEPGEYVGVVKNSVVILKQFNEGLRYQIMEGSLTKDELEHYLGLDEDYDQIIDSVNKDDNVRSALDRYLGYRILRQDPFETAISFIDSANNNVQNIRNQMRALARLFGENIIADYYTFPSISKLANLTEQEIKKAKVGYRGKYMIDSARLLLERNIFSNIGDEDSAKAHEILKDLPGVGNKVADCVLLFSFNRLERVPIDIWTKRLLKTLYSIEPTSNYSSMQSHIYDIHRDYSGYAFSFLFEAARLGYIDCKDCGI